MSSQVHYTNDEQTTDHQDDTADPTPRRPTEFVTALKLRGARPETSPSTGWRGVCLALGVDPDLTGEPRDETTHAAVFDSERSCRNRRKHARGVTS